MLTKLKTSKQKIFLYSQRSEGKAQNVVFDQPIAVRILTGKEHASWEAVKKEEGKVSSCILLRYRVRNKLLFVIKKSTRLAASHFIQASLA